MSFAERLSELIEENGLNNLKLSKATGVSDSLIGEWRKEKKRPNLDNLLLLADYFAVTVDYLVGRSDARIFETKKEPALEISENGQEMLKLYEQLPEREQLLLLGRLQEIAAPLLGSAETVTPPAAEKAV